MITGCVFKSRIIFLHHFLKHNISSRSDMENSEVIVLFIVVLVVLYFMCSSEGFTTKLYHTKVIDDTQFPILRKRFSPEGVMRDLK